MSTSDISFYLPRYVNLLPAIDEIEDFAMLKVMVAVKLEEQLFHIEHDVAYWPELLLCHESLPALPPEFFGDLKKLGRVLDKEFHARSLTLR
jgi:hypothetical protein